MPDNTVMDELQSREEALALRESELNRRELREAALQELREKSLSPEIAEALDYTDETAMRASLERMEKILQAAIQAGVDERLKAQSPAAVRRTPMRSAAALEERVRQAMKL